MAGPKKSVAGNHMRACLPPGGVLFCLLPGQTPPRHSFVARTAFLCPGMPKKIHWPKADSIVDLFFD
jgi:hypothetical protein